MASRPASSSAVGSTPMEARSGTVMVIEEPVDPGSRGSNPGLCRSTSSTDTLPYAAMPISPATTGRPIRAIRPVGPVGPVGPAARTGRVDARSALTANTAQTAVNATTMPGNQAPACIGNGHMSAPHHLVLQAASCGPEIMLLLGARQAPWTGTYSGGRQIPTPGRQVTGEGAVPATVTRARNRLLRPGRARNRRT